MALPTPTALSHTASDGGITLTIGIPNSFSGDAVVRFEPSFYKDHYVEATYTLPSGTSGTRAFTLGWYTNLASLMGGISYNVYVAVKADTEMSKFVNSSSGMVKKPFPIVTASNRGQAGFSVPGLTDSIPANRISERVVSTGEIPYTGTYKAYPRITLTGRFSFAKLVNTATGAFIDITGNVTSGLLRVLDMDPRSAQKGLYGGTSIDNLTPKFSELGERSNTRNFILPPVSEVVRPLAIEAYFFHRDDNTRLEVEYVNHMADM